MSNHIEEVEEVFNIYDEGVYYDEVEIEYEESPFPQQVKVYLFLTLWFYAFPDLFHLIRDPKLCFQDSRVHLREVFWRSVQNYKLPKHFFVFQLWYPKISSPTVILLEMSTPQAILIPATDTPIPPIILTQTTGTATPHRSPKASNMWNTMDTQHKNINKYMIYLMITPMKASASPSNPILMRLLLITPIMALDLPSNRMSMRLVKEVQVNWKQLDNWMN